VEAVLALQVACQVELELARAEQVAQVEREVAQADFEAVLVELEFVLVDLEVCSDPVEVENLEDGRGQHQGVDLQRVDRAQSSQTGIQDGSQVPR
jgi:hypothetical protein